MIKVVDIQDKHLEEIHSWELDEELQVKTGISQPRTKEQFMDSYAAYFRGEKPNLYLKAIETDGILAGKVELFLSDENFIGIVVANKRRRGIGTEALRIFLLEIKQLKRVESVKAEVYEDNWASLQFFMKNGFRLSRETSWETFRGRQRRLVTLSKEI